MQFMWSLSGLAPEATICPKCGKPIPYNVALPGAYNQAGVVPPSEPPLVSGSPSAGPASPYGTSPYAPPPAASYPLPPVSPPCDGASKSRHRLIMLIVGVVALTLVLSGAGIILVPGWLHPLPPPGPSGSPIVPAAATIVNNVQLASAVDTNYQPTQLTNTVAVGQTLSITFDLHLIRASQVLPGSGIHCVDRSAHGSSGRPHRRRLRQLSRSYPERNS